MSAAAHESPDHQAAGTHKVARGGFANLLGAAYSGVASFGVATVVTRISSSEDAGVYFAAVSVLLIAIALAQLGTPVGYVFFFAKFLAIGRVDKLRPTLTAGALPVLAIGVPLTIVAIVFREPLGELLLGAEVSGAGTIMLILGSVLLIAIATESTLGITRGLGVMRTTVVAEQIVNPTAQLLALVLLALAGWNGGADLVWTRAIGITAAALIAIPWMLKLLGNHPAPANLSRREIWRPTRTQFTEYWRFTGPRAIGQFAQVGIQRVDVVLVALWLSPTEAAIYAAATRFLVFGQLAARAIATAVQPQISTLAARRDTVPMQSLYRTSTAWIMFATWPLYLTFIVHADWLMRIFGDEYRAGALVLQVLAATMLIATACGSVDAVLLMAGRSDLTMINAWVALILNLGLNIWLIPTLGILGATLAWAAAILANNLVPLVQVRATLHVHPFGRITLLAALIPAVLFGVVPWVVTLAGGGLLTALGTLAITCLVYVPVLWRLREPLGLTQLLRRSRRRGDATGQITPDQPDQPGQPE